MLDFESVAAFFSYRHRLSDDDIKSFWHWIEPETSLERYVVLDVAAALMNGDEGTSRFAGLLQKEYKEPFVVLDIRSMTVK